MLDFISSRLRSQNRSQASYLPWEWAWHTGIFAGKQTVWLYKSIEPESLLYAPEHVQKDVADRLENTFKELSNIARATRIPKLAARRKFHLLSIKHLGLADTTQDPAKLKAFLESEVYWHQVPKRSIFLGIELRRSLWAGSKSAPPSASRETMMDLVRKATDTITIDNPQSLKPYEKDIKLVEKILYRQQFRNPTAKEMSVIQSWYEAVPGDGICPIVDYPHMLEVENSLGDNTYWEFSAITGWRDALSEGEPWLAIANSLADPAWIISARGELERGPVTRTRAKAQLRKLDETRWQTEKSGDYSRIEDDSLAADVRDVEEHYALNPSEPSIAEFSLMMGRRMFIDPAAPDKWLGEHNRRYTDVLRESYNIQTVALPYQQLAAAREIGPCAPIKIGSRRPFKHHVSLGLLTHSGITAMSELGDAKGAHMGYTVPDETEVRLDFGAASASDKPPTMLIAGQPGSGKTVVSQALLHQATLAGVNSVFVNPKGADSLKPLLDITGGEHVVIGTSTAPGTLDPYRYASQEVATNIAMGFLTIVQRGLKDRDVSVIEEGLRTAKNPKCFMDAVQGIKDAEIVETIEQLRRSNPIIRLCMGDKPGKFKLNNKEVGDLDTGLLLVEFSGDFQLPTAPKTVESMERNERFAVAAVGLLMQATLQLIVASRRGQTEAGTGSFLVIDEAWIMLTSQYLAKAYLESLLRLGRSLDVTIVLATQKVSDLTSVGLDEYVSRVLLMKLTSLEEQELGLKLLNLDPNNPEFRAVLSESGSQRFTDPETGVIRREPPTAWMRDLEGRVGVIRCEFPDALLDMYSTNPEDRRELLRKRKTVESVS